MNGVKHIAQSISSIPEFVWMQCTSLTDTEYLEMALEEKIHDGKKKLKPREYAGCN
jgi:hypothetical protein